MKSCIIENVDDLISTTKKNIDSIKSTGSEDSRTIVMFDLVGSTHLKITEGHDKAVEKIILHNQLSRNFVKYFSGITIKELGDGVLAQFKDAENACLCAINFIEAVKKQQIESKISIATGKIELLIIESSPDVIGSVVDLCSRIEKFAFPNQILIDDTTYNTVLSFLKNYNDVEISIPMNAVIKGHGKRELFEIASKLNGLKNLLNIPFEVNQEGRLLIDDKVSFILNAKSEVIEMGIRLREFTSYFDSRNPAEFKDYVLKLLKNGVSLKCYALDSKWALENLPITDGEKKYYQEIPDTLASLSKFKNEADTLNLKGKVEIYTYQHTPLFHVQCTDGLSKEGRMTASNYLFGIKRSQCPVIQFSKESYPIMFKTYWDSIQETIKTSKPWKN